MYINKKNIFGSIIILLSIAGFIAFIQNVSKKNVTDNSSMTVVSNSTYCNPINIDYRFCLDKPSRREAADPLIVLYKDVYYLFASKLGGYYWSTDLLDWNLVESKSLPLEGYNPAAAVIDGELYYTQQLDSYYKSSNPQKDEWTKIRGPLYPSNDDWLFADNDGKVYLYAVNPDPRSHCGRELDPSDSLEPVGPLKPVVDLGFFETKEKLAYNEPFPENSRKPPFEGSQMTKHNGLYYFQVSHNPTKFFCDYSGDAFVSRSPLGPFHALPNNPVSYRPVGFSTGAANSGWFEDKKGDWWNIVTTSVCCFHQWERRMSLYPSYFDNDDLMYCDTYLGDLPQYLPGYRKPGLGGNLVGWMLLSYKKPSYSSSRKDDNFGFLPGQDKRKMRNTEPYVCGESKYAFDENIRTWWSAQTSDKGEWLGVDLLKNCRINAIQVNFAEEATTVLGRDESEELYHQYVIEVSEDGVQWDMLVDKSTNLTDVPHDYIQLQTPVLARYVRITNIHMPAHGKFAIRDFRIFGNGLSKKPEPVENLEINRLPHSDSVELKWTPAARAEGYVVRYGISPDKLYNSQDVRDGESAVIEHLLPEQNYYFVIDSFNDSGICFGKTIRKE